ncbi:AP-4 complex subunit beta-like [Schistocerca gregaria]|uniref:AP-4 complex subunit beta-like n=1 Tax=Schistocerca gregaria TaxID=7010 RepID=UPI00211E172E|nr:AP-4 complex subunit beta-like [Schistocerca gregaria]
MYSPECSSKCSKLVYRLKQMLERALTRQDSNTTYNLIKETIVYMECGMDVSALFNEVIMACETNNLNQKKLVYQYLVHHAYTNSELVLMAVNTIQKDFNSNVSVVRGLALHSVCSFQNLSFLGYVLPNLKKGLYDQDEYVCQVAALGCSKLFPIAKEQILQSEIIPRLRELVYHKDHLVAYNSMVSLDKILKDQGGFTVDNSITLYLLRNLFKFSSWEKSLIIRVICQSSLKLNHSKIIDLFNLLDPYLESSDPIQVLAISKLFLKLSTYGDIYHQPVVNRLKKPMMNAFIYAKTDEMAFVLLKHLKLLVCADPHSYATEVRHFLPNLDDQIYQYTVKLQILQLLIPVLNLDQLIQLVICLACVIIRGTSICKLACQTLSKCLTRSDIDLPYPNSALLQDAFSFSPLPCQVHASTLREYLLNKVILLLNCSEKVVLAAASRLLVCFLRNGCLSCNAYLFNFIPCSPHFTLDPDICSAIIWIMGELGQHIKKSTKVLEQVAKEYCRLTPVCKLELLNASAKLFFKRPSVRSKSTLLSVLDLAVQDSLIPELVEYAPIISNLIRFNTRLAKSIFKTPQNPISLNTDIFDVSSSDLLKNHFDTLTIVLEQGKHGRLIRLSDETIKSSNLFAECQKILLSYNKRRNLIQSNPTNVPSDSDSDEAITNPTS